MAIVLNHTIVPAFDRVAAATFFAELMGLVVGEPSGPFAPVHINADLTFDFDDRGRVEPGHYGFLVDDHTFDAVLQWLAYQPAVKYGSGPECGWDREINRGGGGRGVYVLSPEGHSYELFTVAP
ncbi:bleomycin resistance protein [Nocardia donostiensis]|uniref:Bleomycin resistance protein n=1 Tax=Nocardia donostiensis TaxID=1538463 RepID=A0A1V2TC88_9NOCA|nr:bleomycin resistance protein [Nocardia donostiensis]ONM47123.1 bleomycin resistance protein [Nocardia donostiensis]OQS15206.1 bleomycin resistance protein [Nocardia donostiensis]OQS20108.1 bleomycin resistance protein [Nocardia donostiensis]